MSLSKSVLKEAFEESLGKDGALVGVPESYPWMARMEKVPYDGCAATVAYHGVIWHSDNGLAHECSSVGLDDDYSKRYAIAEVARECSSWFKHSLWPKAPSDSIKDWYQKACPNDPLGEELADVSFYEYLAVAAKAGDFYVCGVDDSLVRQRMQAALYHSMNCPDGRIEELVYGDDLTR